MAGKNPWKVAEGLSTAQIVSAQESVAKSQRSGPGLTAVLRAIRAVVPPRLRDGSSERAESG